MYLIFENKCIDNTPAVVKVNKLIELNIGQGEGETKWKGCDWNTLLTKKSIYIIYTFKARAWC